MNKTEYDELVQKMYQYCKQYYLYPTHGECEISDYDYDRLYRQLEVFEMANPDLVHSLSPVGKIEGGVHDNG